MRIVMTLVVRDEADIIGDQLDYHLAAGVDFVIVTDHRSRDGTTDILEAYTRRGVLRLIREEREFVRLGEWQTRMARLAATEHDADWVVTSDADEFWWPTVGSLHDVLAAVPSNVGVVRGALQNFVPVRVDGGWFVERMTCRLTAHAPINDAATPYRPAVKVAHRADPNAIVPGAGGHHVHGVSGGVLTSWYPIEVLHFPLRSREQCERKYRKTWTGWESNLRGDLARARQAPTHGRADVVWDRVALDPTELSRGVESGWLTTDTRLRDALRAVRGVAGDAQPRARQSSTWVETSVFEEAELVRRARWLDELGGRVARLEPTRR